MLIPFGDVIRRSFTDVMATRWVGLNNYRTVIQSPAFRLALKNTLLFLVACIPLLLALSLLMALVIHALKNQGSIWRTTFLLPMAIPVASVVLLWKVLFHQQGLVNSLLERIGLTPVPWMQSGAAFWILVLSFIWKNLGYHVILWLAGLAGISESYYEAAWVDGAGTLRVFWSITLPCLLPSLYTIMVLSLLNAFKVFREAYLVAGDYPHQSIYLLQHLFGNWFRELSMERLSAAAVLVALGSLALISLLRKAWEE